MSKHSLCANCRQEVFWSDTDSRYLHWYTLEERCQLYASPAHAPTTRGHRDM